jgi:putative sugar O-methyltransferase
MKDIRRFDFWRKETDPQVWMSIAKLVDRFYGLEAVSRRVTSSHWEKFGRTQKAEFIDDSCLSIQGLGFGDYQNSKNLRLRDHIKNISTTIASQLTIYILPNHFRRIVKNLAKVTDRVVNQDFIRLAKSAESIVHHIDANKSKRVLIIGDGWGTLGCILKELRPELQIIQVNLGRSLLFDLAFSSKALNNYEHNLIYSFSEILLQDFVYMPAEEISTQNANIDLFIAIESFQEMDIEIVNDYFELIRGQEVVSYLYSANRLSKTLPDGSVIRKKDYGWSFQDKVIFEHTPWWLNWGIRRRPPFLFRMDGIIEETLVQISNES